MACLSREDECVLQPNRPDALADCVYYMETTHDEQLLSTIGVQRFWLFTHN